MISAIDTIAALATAQGRAGVAVIRISGASLLPMAEAITHKTPKPRHALFSAFYAEDESVIDQGLLLFFPAPASFTGEDVIELHAHGGRAVTDLLLARVLQLGARMARPGEFTERSFLNGKLDLLQAEAVADLIDATSAQAAKSAVRSLQGDFSNTLHDLKNALINLRLYVEAMLDFPEEEIDFLEEGKIRERFSSLEEKLAAIFARATQGALLQHGLSVVLAGAPNVGKSSLLNALAGDALAIVTPIAGTTRDAVRTTIHLEGVPIHIVDTAGLRETEDEVETIGIERSWQEIHRADLILFLADAQKGFGAEEANLLAQFPKDFPKKILMNKVDLLGEAAQPIQMNTDTLFLSAKTGEGMDALKKAILNFAGFLPQEDTFIARARHLEALHEVENALHLASEQLTATLFSPELFAEALLLAQNALSKITGEFGSDDLLGEIFSRFCIGK